MLGRRFISVPQHLSLMSWVSMPLLVCFICYLPRAVDCQLLESRDLCLLTQLFPLRIEQCLERLQRWFSGSRYLQQGRRCGLTAEVILSALHMCALTYKISQKGAVSASAQLIGRNYIVSILNLTLGFCFHLFRCSVLSGTQESHSLAGLRLLKWTRTICHLCLSYSSEDAEPQLFTPSLRFLDSGYCVIMF